MNCKPGDLARIKAPFAEALCGLVVTVERAAPFGTVIRAKDGGRSVAVSAKRAAWVCHANHPAFPHVVADQCLAPIRDPGDDAKDETLQWLPVPSREEVAA